MRRFLTSTAAPGRWRRRRAARIALALTLVLAAPVVGRPAPAIPADDPSSLGGSPPGVSRVRVVPVPLADPSVADLLQPGDLVDLVGTADPGHGDQHAFPAGPTVVAHAIRVRDTPTGRSGSRSILVEVPEPDAARLASIAAGTPLAVLVHG